MTVLRPTKELLLCLVLICCGLLLTSVYFFQDSRISVWMKFSKLDSDAVLYSLHRNISNCSQPESRLTSSDCKIDYKSSYFKQNISEKEYTKIDGNLFIDDNVSWKVQHFENSRIVSIENNIQELGAILDKKLRAVNIKRIKRYKPTCNDKFKLANSCNNKCLQTDLPENPSTRVEQLIKPRQLQMSTEEHDILRDMADKVQGNYDMILLTAASSNHFLESQALLKNLHENVYPFLQNFTLVFYNLGLTEHERILMIKYCKCQVMDFPFEKFPNFMTKLKCYSWKPVLIKSTLQKTNIVFWMDASIRFHNTSSSINSFIQGARERGIQIGGSSADSSFRTYRSMYHFFGDEPCAYLKLGQAHATLGVYHHEYFVDRVILEPWVACALNEGCICSNDRSNAGCRDSKIAADEYYKGKGEIIYGLCHRFDQSAISIILHKLYQDFFRWVMVRTETVLSIQRKHTVVYFPEV